MRRRKSHAGVALVLVLSLIVLVSMVIVAFLARSSTEQQVSAGSVNASKADLLARSAWDAVIGDLKDEIAKGSDVNNVNGVPIYVPHTNSDIVPSRIPGTSANNAPNLVKYSKRNTPFYTTSLATGGAAASAVSSTTPSLNGRSISPERWNASYLLPRDPGLSGTDTRTTPNPAYFSAPDWVIVTRQGAATPTSIGSGSTALNNPSPGNLNYVIGRYAYMIFDEGGLLDINIAGVPSKIPLNGIKQVTYGHKGGLAFADLSQLTGSSGGVVVNLLTATDIDNIIGWRNYASTQVSGSFGAYSFDGSSSQNYYNFVLGNTNALLSNTTGGQTVATGTTLYPGLTDQMFVSRQQLIQFRRGMNGTAPGFNMDALQYLGTFSREKNAPSYIQPTADPHRPNIDQAVNPDILTIRFPSDTTLTRYRADGSSYTKAVNKGDPLVQMRFPLGRIAWLTTDGTNPNIPNSAAAIKQHFGLVWDTSADANHPRWIYTSPDGVSVASSIKNLSSVAAAQREPDFFELLKAGILEGSLGKTCSDPQHPANDTQSTHSGCDDVNCDIQILRIGANIIDQFDSDSIPTAIRFNNTASLAVGGIQEDVYGVESVPYIARIPNLVYRPAVGQNVGAYFGFVMWDPHQNANLNLLTGLTYPTQFRIVPIPDPGDNTMGQITFRVFASVSGSVAYAHLSSSNGFVSAVVDAPTATLDAGDSITFTRSVSNTAFLEPTLLQTGSSGGSANTSGPNAAKNLVQITSGSGAPGFVGFNVGSNPADLVVVTNGSNGMSWNYHVNGYVYVMQATGGMRPSFEVQCQDPAAGGQWHTYQQFKQLLYAPTAGMGNPENGTITSFLNPEAATSNFLPDPRTMRFGGVRTHNGFDFSNATSGTLGMWPILTSQTGVAVGRGGSTGTGWYWSGQPGTMIGSSTPGNQDFMWPCTGYNNSNGNINGVLYGSAGGNGAVYYSDPDGVFRPGDSVGDPTANFAVTHITGCDPLRPALSQVDPERPVLLNRPARSVAELGYASRDMPWKTLDFWSAYSADSNLLDLFTLTDSDVVAGKVNLNTANAPVLATLLSGVQPAVEVPEGTNNLANTGTSNGVTTAGPLTGTDALNIAKKLVARTSGASGPLKNPGDLVNEFATNTQYSNIGCFASNVKAQREAPLRAIVDSVTTRTWNLMIDVIAQTGRYAKGATASTPLDQFIVEGERRYWVHVAIDRFTGEIIDQQWEAVNE